MIGVAPSFILDAPIDDVPINVAVLNRALQLRGEHDERFAEAIGAATAARTVPGINKNIIALMVALARAMRSSS